MKAVISILLTIISLCSYADEHGEKGFKLDVTVSGFFSPEVKKAIIKSVVEGSSAEKEGIEIGHELVAIDGCKIPGCSASKAKGMLQKNVGETVTLTLVKPDGKTYEALVLLQ